MSVTLPKEVIETLSGRLVFEDGVGPNNQKKQLDAGDQIIVKKSWWPNKTATVTDADVASDENLEAFLQRLVGDRVDVVNGADGEFEYLVYRHGDQLGDLQVINRFGVDKTVFPGLETQTSIDRTIEDYSGRCPDAVGDEDCFKKLSHFTNSAVTYQRHLEIYEQHFGAFLVDNDLTADKVAALVQSASAYAEAYEVYLEHKHVFENAIKLEPSELPSRWRGGNGSYWGIP